jgi:hypothetical protein
MSGLRPIGPPVTGASAKLTLRFGQTSEDASARAIRESDDRHHDVPLPSKFISNSLGSGVDELVVECGRCSDSSWESVLSCQLQ